MNFYNMNKILIDYYEVRKEHDKRLTVLEKRVGEIKRN